MLQPEVRTRGRLASALVVALPPMSAARKDEPEVRALWGPAARLVTSWPLHSPMSAVRIPKSG